MKNTFQEIKLSEIYPSDTNPRGNDFEGPALNDLAASIKEKGVLMPIIIRPKLKSGKKFEIVAGARRFKASQLSGLVTIPARVEELTDIEAREIQIIENLQREDINSLDEGEAYRSLIEKSKSKYDAKEIALKVGKSETYVRQRLGLTNLTEKAKKEFKNGNLLISQALIICRLDNDKQQNDALKEAIDYGADSDRLKEWVENRVYIDLASKPWAKDEKLSEMVGDISAKPENLFGDKALGVDPVAYSKQMAAFIEIKIREAKDKGQNLVKICTTYGTPDFKGVLGKDKYRILTSKDKDVKEVLKGIVVEGRDKGRIYKITTEKEEVKTTIYKKTDKEKAKDKLENEKRKKREEDNIAKFQEAIGKVKFPLSEKQLDTLLDFTFYRCGVSLQQPVVKLIGAELVRTEQKDWNGELKMKANYEASLRKYADDNGIAGKLKVVFALLMPHPSTGDYDNGKDFADASKKL